ncbi:aminotransferase class V-fold PLP-dependent enzyme [Kineosporia sp. J2-2]|uniref:Aminotransferase class V-fold PLP-dependent enzyme n=1 Tax=Kineosporia corallincola TaxID=2835133 RepID=A0ABS5T9E4_9ACTN|nr:aminotransferase class V-fold PLP-dependent enzyme [Kineosporia corallincola]MBT0767453.1 aminotransferase class V-fold PLP-dependent enzyme [Kineosporia corallincola]
MHRYDAGTEVLAEAVMSYSRQRMSHQDVPLDGPLSAAELHELVGQTITREGMGGEKALRLFGDVLAQSCITTDHPRYLSFIPCAPTKAATLFDLVVSASSLYAGTWMEGSGAVYAENQALAWLAGLAGLPEGAGGVFVPGGTFGNLSALVAARYQARQRRAGDQPSRWAVAGTANAHSSIVSACDVMDIDFIGVPVGEDGRLTGEALRRTLEQAGHDGVFAVVATAGTTNLGIVDDLETVGEACAELGLWFHVDGAYGLAGLAAPSVRHRFSGVERADSFVVDPHKWLFAPFDCCALVYRNPAIARAAHTQRAGYLDVVTENDEINPSDYAVGLTRRARGLPFWFSLATHGTQAYTDAVERTLTVTRYATERIRSHPLLDLLHEPELSVVCFRRRGWTPQDYRAWSERLLAEDKGFVVSTTHAGETVTRLAIVNPETGEADIDVILDSLG